MHLHYSHPEDRPQPPAAKAAPEPPTRRVLFVVGPHHPAVREALAIMRDTWRRHPDAMMSGLREDLATARDRSRTVIYCRALEPIAGAGWHVLFHDGRRGIVSTDAVVGIVPVRPEA